MNKIIYNIDKDEAITDYKKLADLDCKKYESVSKGSRIGSTFVDYFTSLQRMDANSKRGINFFDLWEKRDEWKKKPSLANMVAWYKKTSPETPIYNVWWRIFNVYFGSINQFKPLIAMGVYCRYKPTSVLDFTMGWGGRLVGACALNIPKYTGVDLNPDLEQPYANMVKELKPFTDTKIKLYFQDALTVDYSKLDYDLVLTSPPYYNIEIYKGTKKRAKDEWDKEFYEPIFIKTFNGLKTGGHYCLNVPQEVYERVCIKVLGKADEFLPLYKAKRKANDEYKEFIYVWKKKGNISGKGVKDEDTIDTTTKASPQIKKLLYEMTPVNRVGDNWVKRDDKFEYAGQKGGKARSALYLITKDKYDGITTAGNRNSPQINIVSSIGKKLGIPVYAFTSTGELGDEVKVAESKGAKINQVKVGYESVINARARDFSEKKGFLYVPFGMDTEQVHHLTANQVKNIPKEVKRIVVPVGSASSLIGIIKGVKEYRPDIKILGVVVGANPLRKLKKYVPDWKQYTTLKYLKMPYSTPADKNDFNGISLDPYYEAKTIQFIKKGDLLWIVGVRETIDN